MATHSPLSGRATGLTGRRRECVALDRLLDAVRAGESRALVVAGEPGRVPGMPALPDKAVQLLAKTVSDDEDILYLFFPHTDQGRQAGLASLRRLGTRLNESHAATALATDGQRAACGVLVLSASSPRRHRVIILMAISRFAGACLHRASPRRPGRHERTAPLRAATGQLPVYGAEDPKPGTMLVIGG
jgi:hypothetical protein